MKVINETPIFKLSDSAVLHKDNLNFEKARRWGQFMGSCDDCDMYYWDEKIFTCPPKTPSQTQRIGGECNEKILPTQK